LKSTTDEILFLLKTRGPSRTGEVAERLGISRQGSRQQLERLVVEGLVTSETRTGGVGRPRRHWSLTAKGHARFPDSHAQMTVELLKAVRSEFGDDGLDRHITRRERETLRQYEEAIGDVSLEERIKILAEPRAREGYMAEWHREEDGGFLFVENHCPICAAARACQNLCRSELVTFQKVLGANCSVVRVDHLLAGARRCVYRIAARTTR
jgi:predicted ArsR family transcriptional regulator